MWIFVSPYQIQTKFKIGLAEPAAGHLWQERPVQSWVWKKIAVGLEACILKGCCFPQRQGEAGELNVKLRFQLQVANQRWSPWPAELNMPPLHIPFAKKKKNMQVHIYSIFFCKACLLLKRLSGQTVEAVSRLHIFVIRTAAEKQFFFFLLLLSFFSMSKQKPTALRVHGPPRFKLQSATADVTPRLFFFFPLLF